MPSLHHDIVLNIIAVVRDKRDLSSLSLTSSQALQPARAALFHELTITIPTVTPPDSRVWQWADRIVLRLAFFESKSAFARLVRHVHVKEQCQGTKWGHEWTRRIAHALPLVNTVIIDDHYLDALDVAEGLLAVRPCDLDVKTNIDSFVRRDWTKLGARLCRAVLKDPLQVLIPPISPCFELLRPMVHLTVLTFDGALLDLYVEHLGGLFTQAVWPALVSLELGLRTPASLWEANENSLYAWSKAHLAEMNRSRDNRLSLLKYTDEHINQFTRHQITMCTPALTRLTIAPVEDYPGALTGEQAEHLVVAAQRLVSTATVDVCLERRVAETR